MIRARGAFVYGKETIACN